MAVVAPSEHAPTMPGASAAPDAGLAPKLGGALVGLRKDLQVARHLFRNEVTYTVRDPISFDTHAFGPTDYAVLVTLTGERTLSDAFKSLIRDDVVDATQEEDFYRFVLALHRSGLLSLPISDDRSLIQRFESRAAARKKGRWLSAMYCKFPVWNPDAFLVRTLGFGSRFYSRTALVAWLVLMGAALVALSGRWSHIGRELPTLIASEQMLTMWVLLIGLKVVHEFGHAYACRAFGGVVPEMGVTFVMLTPCAYVDASASWGFTRTRDRLLVCAGGVYFESWIAAIAAIVWAFTETSPLHTLAYQAMVLASITTIGFNINRLMRFDGYFILSDLLQIPNLRAQSSAVTMRWIKRIAVGIDPGGQEWSLLMTLVLVTYSVAASAYRVLVTLGICAVIAIKFFAVGMALGILYGASTLFKTLYGCVSYLIASKEVAPVRYRAATVAVVVLIVPALGVSWPLPQSVVTGAVLQREHERIVTTATNGFVQAIDAQDSEPVAQGEPLVVLGSLDVDRAADDASASATAAHVAAEIATARTPEERALAGEELRAAQTRRTAAEEARARLVVRAPTGRTVVSVLSRGSRGRFVRAGTPVATIVAGGWIALALVDQIDLAAMHLQVGDSVQARAASDVGNLLTGRVVSIAPIGESIIAQDMQALTLLGGGDIAVSPTSGLAADVRFTVRVALDELAASQLVRGERLVLRLPAQRASLAQGWTRAILRFRERLSTSE
ncbi:MAG: HlyD family efflux transporter periplasmic adaptor subunit [Phycisphaerae bacterium]|nr:HlyD family efflux transporter periplasmic adaptor subunit [Phycisphaerae bacterium]